MEKDAKKPDWKEFCMFFLKRSIEELGSYLDDIQAAGLATDAEIGELQDVAAQVFGMTSAQMRERHEELERRAQEATKQMMERVRKEVAAMRVKNSFKGAN